MARVFKPSGAALAVSLNAQWRYTAPWAGCEALQAAGEDVPRGIAAILNPRGKKAAELVRNRLAGQRSGSRGEGP
ncbi:MAG: hypothetical protein GY856_38140 [bacterium]|nr:hypothetical protein [bacterium]